MGQPAIRAARRSDMNLPSILTVLRSDDRPHPARLDGEDDGGLTEMTPAIPPIRSALPASAAMRNEWEGVLWVFFSSPSASPTARGRWGRTWGSPTCELRFDNASGGLRPTGAGHSRFCVPSHIECCEICANSRSLAGVWSVAPKSAMTRKFAGRQFISTPFNTVSETVRHAKLCD